MKATYNGWEIDGTPEEIAEVIGAGRQEQQHRAEPEEVEEPIRVAQSFPVRAQHTGKHKHWTSEDDALVLENYGSKGTKVIAKQIGRTMKAVRVRFALLSKKAPVVSKKAAPVKKQTGNSGEPWTAKEDAVLRQMYARGTDRKEVAIALGRTVGAVAVHAVKLGVHRAELSAKESRIRKGQGHEWTKEDDAVLKSEFERQKPHQGNAHVFNEYIAKRLGRTPKSVNVRRTLKGLVIWKRKGLAKKAVRETSTLASIPATTSTISTVYSQPFPVQKKDVSALEFKEAKVDAPLVESVLKHMIKMGTRLNYPNAGYLLGAETVQQFRDWMVEVIARSDKLSAHFGVANKFKTDGKEIWYG